jgi:hypothetical protein
MDRYPCLNQVVKSQVLRNYQILLSERFQMSGPLNKHDVPMFQVSDLDVQQVITGTAAELTKFLLLWTGSMSGICHVRKVVLTK